MARAPAIGIDFGTTKCCVAVFQNENVEIITNDQGNRTTASYVAFTNSQRLVGDVAKNQVVGVDPNNTIFDVKRLIGRRFNHPVIQSNIKHWPFRLINDKGKPKIYVEYKGEAKYFCPEEISSMVLCKMKETAEAYLGQSVTDAVISVPAHFGFFQRQATKDAGTIAGLKVIRTINEPTAAAVAYALENRTTDEIRDVMIFDLGGSTLDVSIVTIEDKIFEVKSTAGNFHLGGEDFDNRMVTHFIQEFKHKHKKDLSFNQRALRRLRASCEKAKRTLSSSSQANIELDSLFDGIDFYSSISRTKFEELNSDLFRLVMESVEKAIRDAKMKRRDIDDIVLVGGSSRIPKIQKLLQDFFGGKELNKSINPDEAVAYGAAIQAAALHGDRSKKIQNFLLLEVTPLSLGIETTGGLMIPIIKRSTTIPIRETHTVTNSNNETFFSMQVFEGEHALVKDNHFLGRLLLSGIPPKSQIEVMFEIDAYDILIVTATETSTNKSNKIIIPHKKHHLSKEDIERMINDAKKYRIEDEKLNNTTAAKNSLESYCYNIQSIVEENMGKMSEFKRHNILDKCVDIITWLDSNQSATREEYQSKQKDLEIFYSRISNDDSASNTPKSSRLNEERQSEAVAAKYNLQTYCCNIKVALQEVKDKVSYPERSRIIDKCNEFIKWLDTIDYSGKVEDFECKRKELENLYKSTINKSSNENTNNVSNRSEICNIEKEETASVLVPSNFLNDVKCGKCDRFLSFFPIYTTKDKLPVCGRCSHLLTEKAYVRNTLYESLVQYLKFPCVYRADGCLQTLSPLEIPKHEEECCFRMLSCTTADCVWQGTIKSLLDHFEAMHPNSILKNNDKFELNFLSSYETYQLLVFKDELFNFKQKFDDAKSILECSLSCYQITGTNTQYSYEITVENVIKNISVKLPQKSAEKFGDENITKIVLKDLITKLKDPSIIIGTISVLPLEDETPSGHCKRTNPQVNYDLLMELECPVCFDYITPPIYQCVTGHSICADCKRQISECPSCKADIKNTQNFTLEKMAYLLTYPCKFIEQGCDFTAKPMEMKEHQKCCMYGLRLCPLNDYDDNCYWKGSGKDIFSHIVNLHNDYVLKINTINTFIDRNYFNSKDCACYIIKFFDVLFKLHYLYKEDVFYWAVQLIGPPEESKMYKFEIDVVDNTGNDQKMLLRHFCAPLSEKSNSFDTVDNYAFIRLLQIKSFITDVLTYTVRIVK